MNAFQLSRLALVSEYRLSLVSNWWDLTQMSSSPAGGISPHHCSSVVTYKYTNGTAHASPVVKFCRTVFCFGNLLSRFELIPQENFTLIYTPVFTMFYVSSLSNQQELFQANFHSEISLISYNCTKF